MPNRNETVRASTVKTAPREADLDLRVVTTPRRLWVREALRSRGARAVFLGALVLVGLWRVWGYRVFIEPPYLTDSDLTPDYVAAQEWTAGRDPYGLLRPLVTERFGPSDPSLRQMEPGQRNAHPPVLILLHAPASALGIRGMRAVELGAMVGAIFLAVFLFCRELAMRRTMAAALAFGALALPIVRFDMRWGQINGLVLLGLVLAWRALRSGKDARAGMWLGAVIAMKIFPLLLLIPLIRMRRTKAVAWTMGSATAFTLVGVAALGMEAAIKFVTVASPVNYEIWGAAPFSISLVALPFRLFASGRWLNPGFDVSMMVMLLGVAAFVGCAVAAWRTSARVTGDLFWAATPWMILASPLAWTHYLVILLPLGALAWSRRHELSRAGWLAVVVPLVVIASGDSLVQALSKLTGASLMQYGTVVMFTTLIVAAVAIVGVNDLSRTGRTSARRRVIHLDSPAEIGVRA